MAVYTYELITKPSAGVACIDDTKMAIEHIRSYPGVTLLGTSVNTEIDKVVFVTTAPIPEAEEAHIKVVKL